MVMAKSALNVCAVVLHFDLSQKAEKQCSCALNFASNFSISKAIVQITINTFQGLNLNKVKNNVGNAVILAN